MRIDLCIPSLHVGGSERQITGLAIAFTEAGHDVAVVALHGGGVLEKPLHEAGVPVVILDRARQETPGSTSTRRLLASPALATRLAKHWRRRRPEAMQAWLPEAQIVALPIARALGIPHRVMALRSLTSSVNLGGVSTLALRVAARSSTYVTGNSAAVLGDPGWPIGNRPRVVIPNAVDIPDLAADVGVQPPRGIVVANLLAYKGHEVLLEALARLPDPPRMDFVGRGPLRDQLEGDIDRLGLASRIRIHDSVSEPLPMLLASQFFVLPSLSEGLPNALLEAMAAGLPVVATRVGGVGDVVDDGESGLLVEPGDVAGLAKALDLATGDPAWRMRAGTAARARMADFAWAAMVQQNLRAMS